MKSINFFVLLATVAIISFSSCEDDDDYGQQLNYTICVDEIIAESDRFSQETLEVMDWPTQVRSYFTSEFSGFAIASIKSFTDANDSKFYLLEGTNGGQLLFDSQFDFICGDDTFQLESGKDDENIALEDLPQVILDYISSNYPGIEIDEAEFEDGEYEIELKNGIELCFDQAGNFIGEC